MRGVPLGEAIKQVAARKGGIRALAREAGLSAGYLSKLANGHKTQAKADVLTKLGIERQPALYIVAAEPESDLPERVYYSPGSDNFYNGNAQGMGSEFYTKWVKRKSEFPQSLKELEDKLWTLR